MKFEVQFYEKENGERPAEEFMLSVDDKMRAKLSGLVKMTSAEYYTFFIMREKLY